MLIIIQFFCINKKKIEKNYKRIDLRLTPKDAHDLDNSPELIECEGCEGNIKI